MCSGRIIGLGFYSSRYNEKSRMEKIETVWCDGKDWCPVTVTASLIGKKWHPVIISRLMVAGDLGFAELQERIPDISSKVLSDSLEELEEKGLIDREIVNEKPFRVKYSLTDQGESLEPVIDDMHDWGTDYLDTVGVPP